MAPYSKAVKLRLLFSLQSLSLLSLMFQMHGIFAIMQIFMKLRSDVLAATLSKRRKLLVYKMKRIKMARILRKPRTLWYREGRTDQWWVNMMNGSQPEEEWKKNFRISRTLFYELVHKIRDEISPNPNSPNYRSVDAMKKVALTLYYLKDTGSLRMTANAFGVHVTTASKIIHEVCKAITHTVGPEYIYLPKNESEMRMKAAEFEAKFGLLQAFGCIDGTHIPLKRPDVNSQDYFCYKMFFSLNTQAVCDYRGVFMDVDCRWPGSVHDAKVFANSSINSKLREGELPVTYQEVFPGRCKVGNYLIGDPAYPLTPYIMKEYETCSNNSKVVFNNILRSARNPIECAYGRLKARWGFLTRPIGLNLEFIPTAVYACFVLHNYCEEHKCYIEPELVEQQYAAHLNYEKEATNVPHPVFSGNLDEGVVIRDILTSYIKDNLPDHYS